MNIQMIGVYGSYECFVVLVALISMNDSFRGYGEMFSIGDTMFNFAIGGSHGCLFFSEEPLEIELDNVFDCIQVEARY